MLKDQFTFTLSNSVEEGDTQTLFKAERQGSNYLVSWFNKWEETTRTVDYTVSEAKEAIEGGYWLICG